MQTATVHRRLLQLLWLVPAIPGVYQLVLLAVTIARRWSYPYDLEWMEGGMLAHAMRLGEGESIYAPPSVDFIPFLYTPLYPATLALLSKVFPLGYGLGRMVSIVSTAAVIAIGIAAVVREAPRGRRVMAAAAGASVAGGFLAATYPWVDGWYDLVRNDAFFLAIAVGGLAWLRAAAKRPGTRLRGFWHPGVAIAAAILAVSFHAKQTGVLFVAAGGAALLVMNWRACATYVVVAGTIGGGGAAILSAVTDGWYWIYVFRVHQQHDTDSHRFWRSFANIWGQFPALTIVVVAGLIAVGVIAARRRRLPSGAGGFLYWSWMFLCGTVVGALGWATQWAVFNAYIPAMTLGAIAAACAVTAIAGCADESELPGWQAAWARVGTAGVAFALLAVNLWSARWDPRPFVPTGKDRAAGDALIEKLRAIDGEVYVPAHPWYSVLAGKRPYVHRMGILDVGYRAPKKEGKEPLPPRAHIVEGLSDALRSKRFAAVVMDDRCQPHEFPGLTQSYQIGEKIPRARSPRMVSGAKTVPSAIWIPKSQAPPPPKGKEP
jgi:hypothetical protein